MAKAYSPDGTLINTGMTRDGPDTYADGSIMGIVAHEQLSFLSDDEIIAAYRFLHDDWTSEKAPMGVGSLPCSRWPLAARLLVDRSRHGSASCYSLWERNRELEILAVFV